MQGEIRVPAKRLFTYFSSFGLAFLNPPNCNPFSLIELSGKLQSVARRALHVRCSLPDGCARACKRGNGNVCIWKQFTTDDDDDDDNGRGRCPSVRLTFRSSPPQHPLLPRYKLFEIVLSSPRCRAKPFHS